MSQKILVTGGLGYIGSHVVVELCAAGYEPVIIDNLSNARQSVLERLERLTQNKLTHYDVDIRNRAAMETVLQREPCVGLIHLAAFKAVGESVEEPLKYYDNNVAGSVALFDVFERAGGGGIVFSSSAMVYGDVKVFPLHEGMPVQPNNPYGATKAMMEQVLADVAHAPGSKTRGLSLRYFNPAGAHESALIGEDPKDRPNNLFPIIVQVAVGNRDHLTIFGEDYDTPDGTGVRDYIHVVDLAKAHVMALRSLIAGEFEQPFTALNLGTGTPYSVRQVVSAFEDELGQSLPQVMGERRGGDVATLLADPSAAQQAIGWTAELGLSDMVRDAWRWAGAARQWGLWDEDDA
ncbi:MAG: UDP-glucose 4-epimerase GalE [Alphaproteobacteria bacterium]